MLANQPSNVLSVRSSLASKAGRVRRVVKRQNSPVENLFSVQIRQRHFCRRDQVQIPVAADLEKVCFELGEVARPSERRPVDEQRRLDLSVAMLTGVQIEHEVDQRALQPS